MTLLASSRNQDPAAGQVRPKALSVLLEASSLLLHASSEEQLLSQTLDFASTLLVADAYVVWRESETFHSDVPQPTAVRIWKNIARRGLSSNFPNSVDMSEHVIPRAVWTMENVRSDERCILPQSIYEQEGVQSAMVVPWQLDSAIPTGVHGAVVYYWFRPRSFSQDDVDYAQALSNLCASALNRLDLREQTLREQQRLAFLADTSTVLSSSLDYQSTLERVAQLAVARIADWCIVHVAGQGTVAKVATAHADPAMAAFAEQYARLYPEQISPDRGVGKVLSTGEPEVVSHISEEMVSQAAIDETHLDLLRQLKLTSSIVVPLLSHSKVLGAIRLLGTHGRNFGPGDLQLALDLGRRAAAAIENAQLHSELIEQDHELRLSHAAAKMGSWTWDIEHDKLYWSSEFKALHGLPQSAEADIEKSYLLVHPEDRERSQKNFWECLHSSAALLTSEHRSIMPDGRVLWLQVRGRIRRDANGKATWISGLIIDVTESRLAEQALRRTEKLAAAGRLAATVAHEVNNPLGALMNVIYLAQQVDHLPLEASTLLSVADAELRRIAHIVRQTLGFYRESTFLTQSTGIQTLISETLELYRSRSISRGVALRTASDPNPAAEIYASIIPGEIKQVLANLISNAIDATPPGGFVEASAHQSEPPREFVEIAITDSGTGISPANRKRLFEPFFTTKADVGTGLGLWVSKGIVEKHKGEISIDEPAPDSKTGTTFRVRLPLRS